MTLTVASHTPLWCYKDEDDDDDDDVDDNDDEDEDDTAVLCLIKLNL